MSRCAWKKPSMASVHVGVTQKSPGFLGSPLAASRGGRLLPQSAEVGRGVSARIRRPSANTVPRACGHRASRLAVAVVMSTLQYATGGTEPNGLNVLLIAIDDLKPMLGCHGRSIVEAPRWRGGGRPAFSPCLLPGPALHAVAIQRIVGPPARPLRNGTRRLTGHAPPGTVSLPTLFRQHGDTTVSAGKTYHYNDDAEGWVRRHVDACGCERDWCHGYRSGYQLPANRNAVRSHLSGSRLSAGMPAPPITKITGTPKEQTPDGMVARDARSRSCGGSRRRERPSSLRPASTVPTCR